ncbi:MAG: 50S ribosomal protein L6 [Candidatus Marinimicrobia bacterium]|nr:50S ribosomal protein L6 [Candidatus Neomarinimicrobiota bacterium]
MSRIGKSPIRIPEGVNIALNSNSLVVTGPKGSLNLSFSKSLTVTEIEGNLMVDRSTEEKHHKAIHGTTRQLIQNMILGVTIGYKKELELVGVGYQASVQGKRLKLQLGFSHDIFFDVPPSIQVTAERTSIKVEGIDKQLVGIVAAKIRSFRPPEPYKGKGVRYKSEYVRSKQGKTVGAK